MNYIYINIKILLCYIYIILKLYYIKCKIYYNMNINNINIV